MIDNFNDEDMIDYNCIHRNVLFGRQRFEFYIMYYLNWLENVLNKKRWIYEFRCVFKTFKDNIHRLHYDFRKYNEIYRYDRKISKYADKRIESIEKSLFINNLKGATKKNIRKGIAKEKEKVLNATIDRKCNARKYNDNIYMRKHHAFKRLGKKDTARLKEEKAFIKYMITTRSFIHVWLLCVNTDLVVNIIKLESNAFSKDTVRFIFADATYLDYDDYTYII